MKNTLIIVGIAAVVVGSVWSLGEQAYHPDDVTQTVLGSLVTAIGVGILLWSTRAT